MAEIVPNVVNHKISAKKKTIRRFLKKEKKCWFFDGTFFQRQISGSTEPFVALGETSFL
jgi:hypothetical protein